MPRVAYIVILFFLTSCSREILPITSVDIIGEYKSNINADKLTLKKNGRYRYEYNTEGHLNINEGIWDKLNSFDYQGLGLDIVFQKLKIPREGSFNLKAVDTYIYVQKVRRKDYIINPRDITFIAICFEHCFIKE